MTGRARSTEIGATAPDGYPVHGWLMTAARPGPHPVLLLIHGGPDWQFQYQLFDEAQVYASRYAVVLANPRGSVRRAMATSAGSARSTPTT